MRAEIGFSSYPIERVTGWIGNGMQRLVKRGLTGEIDGEPDPALFERGLESFKRHYAANIAVHTRAYPGVIEALNKLAAEGFLLGCVTNKMEMFTRPLLEQLGLMKYMCTVVGGDTLPVRKPDPAPLRHACTIVGVGFDQAIMVGDSATDINAGRAANIPIVAVTYGYNQGRDVRDLNPDLVVDSLAELPQYLRLATA